eukprot:1157553-Pelagomonas_calceolata.AAC.9
MQLAFRDSLSLTATTTDHAHGGDALQRLAQGPRYSPMFTDVHQWSGRCLSHETGHNVAACHMDFRDKI